MSTRVLVGDCRETLAALDAGSIQSCITSPPYYGLRDYGTPPLVWGQTCCEHPHEWGDKLPAAKSNQVPQTKWANVSAVSDGQRAPAGQFCTHEHEWQDATWRNSRLNDDTAGRKQRSNNGSLDLERRERPGEACACGAWRGSLGLEPTPEMYVEHLVEVFRQVRRVLRPDGLVWLNLGDSYNNRGVTRPSSHQGGLGFDNDSISTSWREHAANGQAHLSLTSGGLKEKDLLMVPFRVALALQQDGWYLRSVIPWLKRNSMPESVRDRPSTSIEYVFLLAKSARYYYDADAVRMPHTEGTHSRGGIKPEDPNLTTGKRIHNGGWNELPPTVHPAGRNRRNADWFFESWQGLMLDEDDDPLALVVNPQPFKGSHFATFPAKLVEPMVKASTSEKGQCPECGAPWQRLPFSSESDYARLKREQGLDWPEMRAAADAEGRGLDGPTRDMIGSTRKANGTVPSLTAASRTHVGWQAGCEHALEPIPQTVLDPFGGAGTVGLVADRLGRSSVLCDLSDEYVDMGAARITEDAPLFTQVELL